MLENPPVISVGKNPFVITDVYGDAVVELFKRGVGMQADAVFVLQQLQSPGPLRRIIIASNMRALQKYNGNYEVFTQRLRQLKEIVSSVNHFWKLTQYIDITDLLRRTYLHKYAGEYIFDLVKKTLLPNSKILLNARGRTFYLPKKYMSHKGQQSTGKMLSSAHLHIPSGQLTLDLTNIES